METLIPTLNKTETRAAKANQAATAKQSDLGDASPTAASTNSVASTLTEQSAVLNLTPPGKMAPRNNALSVEGAVKRNNKKRLKVQGTYARKSRTYDTFRDSVTHSEKWQRNPQYWEKKMKQAFSKNGGNTDKLAKEKKEFVLQFAGEEFQQRYGFDYWLYACMDKRGTQTVFPPWACPPPPLGKPLTLDILKERTYGRGVDPFKDFPRSVQLYEPEEDETAMEKEPEDDDLDKKPAAKMPAAQEGNDKKPTATENSLLTNYCYGDREKTTNQRRKLRLKFQKEGDTSYEVLRECITVDPSLPAPLGFQITNIPIKLFVALVKGIGSPEYTTTFERCGDLINLTIDEQAIMQLVMGDVETNTKGQVSLKPTPTVAVAMDRFAQVTGEARLNLETRIVDHVSEYEEFMADNPFKSDNYPIKEAGFNHLNDDKVDKWTAISMSVRKMPGWPESFTELAGSDDNQNPSEALNEQLELNLDRAEQVKDGNEISNGVLLKWYQSTLGFVPMWERTQHGTYLMHAWGMDHLNSNRKHPPLAKRDMAMKQLAEFPHGVGKSSYLDIGIGEDLGKIHDAIQDIIHKCIIIVMGGNPDDKQYCWDYVASSGIVRTGRPPLTFYEVGDENVETRNTGQEIHLDNKKMLGVELMRTVAAGTPKTGLRVKSGELEKWGWIGDLCLSEGGRPYKTTRFDPDNQQLKVKVGWTPCGTINVRHMCVPHAGHGGPCGSTLFHTTIVPKEHAKLFDGEHLAYIRLLGVHSMRRSHKKFFNDWKVVWEPDQKQNVNEWEDNINRYQKARGANYSNEAWKGLQNDVEAMRARWLCSPNDTEAFAAMYATTTLKGEWMDAEGTSDTRKAGQVKSRKVSTEPDVVLWSTPQDTVDSAQEKDLLKGIGLGMDEEDNLETDNEMKLPESANFPSDSDASMSGDDHDDTDTNVGGADLNQQEEGGGKFGEDEECEMEAV